LLDDIQRRAKRPLEGAPPLPEDLRPCIDPEDPASAILLNRSAKTIAAIQAVWHFETETGRTYRHSRSMLSPQALLLPFGRSDEKLMNLYRYWQTILPGSKRYLAESGMVGDNTDVRPPGPEEKWRGGMIGSRGGSGGGSREPQRQITLALDGVFFLDGEFVGPDRERTYERTVAQGEARLTVAHIARAGYEKGKSPHEILRDVEKVTGPAPARPPMTAAMDNPDATPEQFLEAALQQISFELTQMERLRPRDHQERAVRMMLGWAETVLPNFRKG
jgi:hypothetical protein